MALDLQLMDRMTPYANTLAPVRTLLVSGIQEGDRDTGRTYLICTNVIFDCIWDLIGREERNRPERKPDTWAQTPVSGSGARRA